MGESAYLKVCVENFGPVRRGEFELKPLTIFIGPNNSGKSYMALLVYAMCRGLSWRSARSLPHVSKLSDFERHSEELEEWLNGMYRQIGAGQRELVARDLPQKTQQTIRKGLKKIASTLREDVEEALLDYFGCEELDDLIRDPNDGTSLKVRLNDWNERQPLISFQLEPGKKKSKFASAIHDDVIKFLRIPLAEVSRRFGPFDPKSPGDSKFFVHQLWLSLWREFLDTNGIPASHGHEAFYLPAARSGILQGWPVFASMALQIVRHRLGLKKIEMPPFRGVAGDFLQVLWERLLSAPRRGPSPQVLPALAFLESEVFRGEVSLEGGKSDRPLILYKFGDLALPLQRASSMVAELAPLGLWLKYLLRPGSLLIVDEPEAHLHPESQRRIARVLVRLVNAGVRILCTTHSSLILHQVSNHLLASEADPKRRDGVDFSEHDLLKSDQVGVYLFKLQQDGTQVDHVPIKAGFGISEDEFVRVAEAIGDETFRLSSPVRTD